MFLRICKSFKSAIWKSKFAIAKTLGKQMAYLHSITFVEGPPIKKIMSANLRICGTYFWVAYLCHYAAKYIEFHL
jgi:hypothetical protein